MPALFLKFFVSVLLLNLALSIDDAFVFNGFHDANFSLDGAAKIATDGLLRLTNSTDGQVGHALHSTPLHFTKTPGNHSLSFSSAFVFAIVPEFPEVSGYGMAFVLSPVKELPSDSRGAYMGIFNPRNEGNPSNHVLAIELDTTVNSQFRDINDNHVGIDVNSIISINSSTAGYTSKGRKENLTLASGNPMQLWVEYDGVKNVLNVTLSPFKMPKPDLPLLSITVNLSEVILDTMYAGFSASVGKAITSHYVLGWGFQMNGKVQELDPSRLPSLPRRGRSKKTNPMTIWLPIVLSIFLLIIVAGLVLFLVRKIMFSELLEDWELEYGPHRFSYKDLYKATKGFKDSLLVGVGGFGRVYRGVLPGSTTEVAVKKVSHGSRQGMKEFVAEVVSIGRLRHRNLVQLLGYCRRKGELLLIYDFMPNGSLDKFLHDERGPTLNWNQRLHIIKGVACGILYLHEEWEQVVIHRDIKASNVLLDSEFNGRLGDFGLARLYDHGTGPQTTHVVGTMGYIAPELTETGKASKASDVFAFGAFLLEVVCGKRPIEPQASEDYLVLVDWVLENWRTGAILGSIDPRLRDEYVSEEVELVLMLGLRCSHPSPDARPSMRQVKQLLDGDMPPPEFSSDSLGASRPSSGLHWKEVSGKDVGTSNPTSVASDWLLSGGR